MNLRFVAVDVSPLKSPPLSRDSTVKNQRLLASTATSQTSCQEIIAELQRLANPKNVAGMARFGISGKTVLGIPMGPLRAIARRVGRNHALAGELWASGILEARVLAAFVAEPDRLTWRQEIGRAHV